MHGSKPFWFTAGLLLVIVAAGLTFQRPYVSPEARYTDDRNQLLRIMLENQASDTSRARGFTILRTAELTGLDIPSSMNGVPVNIITEEKIDKNADPLYSTIRISVYGSCGNVTITHYWQMGPVVMDSGLTLYCSKMENAWNVDYGFGWVP